MSPGRCGNRPIMSSCWGQRPFFFTEEQSSSPGAVVCLPDVGGRGRPHQPRRLRGAVGHVGPSWLSLRRSPKRSVTTRLPSPRPATREQSPRKRPACATAQCAGQGCRAVGDAGRGPQDGRSRRGQPAAPAASLRSLGPQLQGTVWAPRRTEAEPVREELQTAGGPGTVQTDPSPPRREAAV